MPATGPEIENQASFVPFMVFGHLNFALSWCLAITLVSAAGKSPFFAELRPKMSDPTNVVLVFAVVGLTVATGVWLLVRANSQHSASSGKSLGELSDMRIIDWFNTAVNIGLGVLLGVVIVGLVQLITTGFWLIAILIPIIGAGLLLFDGLFNGLVDKIFPSGIRPARKSPVRRRAPLPKRLSLPVGIVVGVALAQAGLGDKLLGIIL